MPDCSSVNSASAIFPLPQAAAVAKKLDSPAGHFSLDVVRTSVETAPEDREETLQ